MTGRVGFARGLLAGALVCAGLICVGLAGCSDGVEVNSKLLDYVGVGAVGSHSEPALTDRQGLVIPPPMAALPEPGSGVAVAAGVNAQLPQNPETVARLTAAQKKKQEAEACANAKRHSDDSGLQGACPGLIAKLAAGSPDDSAQ